jgi:hypothetical protein
MFLILITWSMVNFQKITSYEKINTQPTLLWTSIRKCRATYKARTDPFFSFWWWRLSGNHPKKDFAFMATSSRKTLKTIKNLAGKPEWTMRSCLILANSFFPGVIKFGRILKNLQKIILLVCNFVGCNFTPVCQKADKHQVTRGIAKTLLLTTSEPEWSFFCELGVSFRN